jgi:transglutaminase-like putative cysteine protease
MKLSVPHPLAPELRALSARDLAGLSLALAIVIAPHALRAPWWLTLLTLACVAWRAAALAEPRLLPSRALLLAVVAVAILGVWVEYRTIFGRTPGIVLLMVFAGLKVLESRSHRDATLLVFLACFLMITNFFYTQSIPTALAMCVALGVLATTLVGFNAPQRPLRACARSAALLLAHAVPAALALFVLFPRVPGPLWGLPQDAYAGMTGLSDTMSPGNIAQLALSDTIAFRAEFQGEAPRRPELYWRGPVLWDFDGRTWRGGEYAYGRFVPPQGERRFSYSVVLEPHNRNWLFALETLASLPPRARYLDDGQLLAPGLIRQRIRYSLDSVADAAPAARESRAALQRALALPEGFSPRARALGADWRRGAATDGEVLARAIEFLRRERFEYTLEPPLLGRDPVDEFLFGTKAGFCEHFASSFAFLMRAAGVPARVVTGYQGGDLNPVDRQVTVRQSDAHAWTEVYLQGRGWLRVDPTATAVPGRVEVGLARAVPEGAGLPLLMRPQLEWLRGLRYRWEALAHQWNLWVLGYNPERQRELAAWLGLKDADWRSLTAALFTLLGVLTILLLAWSLRHSLRSDPVQRAWRAFCRKLGARGLERAPSEGPRDYAARAAERLPVSREAIESIGALYLELRYGRPAAGARGEAAPRVKIAELKRLVRELKLA